MIDNATNVIDAEDPSGRKKAPALFLSEAAPLVFISSVMDSETEGYRKEAVEAVHKVANLQPWAFEFTSASSDAGRKTQKRKSEENT